MRSNTSGATPGKTLLVTGYGEGAFAGQSDTIAIEITNATPIATTETITVNGVLEADQTALNTTFAAGEPVELELTAEFSDGNAYTSSNSSEIEVHKLIDEFLEMTYMMKELTDRFKDRRGL